MIRSKVNLVEERPILSLRNISDHNLASKIARTDFDLSKRYYYSMNNLVFVDKMLELKYTWSPPQVDITDEECLTELKHIAENILNSKTLASMNDMFNIVIRCLEAALNYSKKLYPGNTNSTAYILHDLALAYLELNTITKSEWYSNNYKKYEDEYENMVQKIKQGILN